MCLIHLLAKNKDSNIHKRKPDNRTNKQKMQESVTDTDVQTYFECEKLPGSKGIRQWLIIDVHPQ